ncbi:MAG: hypothetical protein Q9201_007535, partial [Fulgogasparrea decipioides]
MDDPESQELWLQAAETYTRRMLSKDFFCQLAIYFERDPDQYTQVLDNVASWQDLVKANLQCFASIPLAAWFAFTLGRKPGPIAGFIAQPKHMWVKGYCSLTFSKVKSIRGRDETTKTSLTRIQSSSKQLSERFSDFEAARESDSTNNASRDMLLDVLTRISEFDVCSLQTALESSPFIDPSLKTYLPLAISKLRRYYCIACDLIDAARSSQYTLFRRISVQAMEKPHVNMAFIADHSAGFDQTLQR